MASTASYDLLTPSTAYLFVPRPPRVSAKSGNQLVGGLTQHPAGVFRGDGLLGFKGWMQHL